MKKVEAVRLGILTVLGIVLVVVWFGPGAVGAGQSLAQIFSFYNSRCPEARLCVSYLDVGQGDATLIESPTGVQVLIDGGPDSAVLRELGQRLGYFDRNINMVVATHPDSDHIGGLILVLERYVVDRIVRTDNYSDTPIARAFDAAVVLEDAIEHQARRGQVYDLGGGALLTVYFPDRPVQDIESNTSSIVAELTYGDTEFLFTGDAPKSIETYVASIDADIINTDVLKVGHHGSKTSTDELFVTATSPEWAVISAGRDNRYGHPHSIVRDTLQDISVLETAKEGTITFVSDGVDIYRD